jgi:hypothetical protein
MRRESDERFAASKLTTPLSEWIDSLDCVPARDVGAWVSRSIRSRHEETRQRRGRITRPLNSFMLYRSAYIERAKAWCRDNRQSYLSSFIAESWLLEKPQLRRLYAEYASIEKKTHRLAYPMYVFYPKGSKIASSKKHQVSPDEDSNEYLVSIPQTFSRDENFVVSPSQSIRRSVSFSQKDMLDNRGRRLTSDNYTPIPFWTTSRAWQPTLPLVKHNLLHGRYYQHTTHQSVDTDRGGHILAMIPSISLMSNNVSWGDDRTKSMSFHVTNKLVIGTSRTIEPIQANIDICMKYNLSAPKYITDHSHCLSAFDETTGWQVVDDASSI